MSDEDISLRITQYDLLLKLDGVIGPPGPEGPQGPKGDPGVVELHGDNTFGSLLLNNDDVGTFSVIDSAHLPFGSVSSDPFKNAMVQFDKTFTQDHIESVLAVTAVSTGYIPSSQYEKIGISSQVIQRAPTGHWGAGAAGAALARESAAIPYLGQGIIQTVSTNIIGVPASGDGHPMGTKGQLVLCKGSTQISVISISGFYNAAEMTGNFIIQSPITLDTYGYNDTYSGLVCSYTDIEGGTYPKIKGITYRHPRHGQPVKDANGNFIPGQFIPEGEISGLPVNLMYGELICAVGYAEGGLFEPSASTPLSDGALFGIEIGVRNPSSIGVIDSASEKAGIWMGTHEDTNVVPAAIKHIRTSPQGLVRITAEYPGRAAHGLHHHEDFTIAGMFGAYAVLNGDHFGANLSARLVSENEFDVPGTAGLNLADWDYSSTVVDQEITTPIHCLWNPVTNSPATASNPPTQSFDLLVDDASGFLSATAGSPKSFYIGTLEYVYTGRVIGSSVQNKLTGCYGLKAAAQNRLIPINTVITNAGQLLKTNKPPAWAITFPYSHETWQNGFNLRGVIDTFINISMPSGKKSGISTVGIDMPNDPDPDWDWGPNANAIILPNDGSLKGYTKGGVRAHMMRLASDNTVRVGSPGLSTWYDGNPVRIGSLNPGDHIYMYGALDMQDHKIARVGTPVAADQAANKGYVDKAGSLAQSGVAVPIPNTNSLAEQILIGPIPIDSGAMGKNGRIKVILNVSRNTGGAGTVTVRVRFGAKGSGLGGTILQRGNLSTSEPYALGVAEIYNRGDVAKQNAGPDGTLFDPYTPASSSQLSAIIDTTGETEINITGDLSSLGDSVTIQGYQVILYPSN